MRMLTESLVVGESTRGLVGAAETAAPPKLLRIPWIPWENRQQKSEFCGRTSHSCSFNHRTISYGYCPIRTGFRAATAAWLSSCVRA